MPWLVIYIGFLFPIALLLVVLATDWRQRQHERRRASVQPISDHVSGTNPS